MTKFLTLLFALMIPALAFAEEPVAPQPEQPRLCLVSTTVDDGEHTLTNVQHDAQLVLGQRGSIKLTLKYEERAEGRCDELKLELPAEGTVGDATITAGKMVLVIPNAGVMSHGAGEIVLAGDSVASEHLTTPQS